MGFSLSCYGNTRSTFLSLAATDVWAERLWVVGASQGLGWFGPTPGGPSSMPPDLPPTVTRLGPDSELGMDPWRKGAEPPRVEPSDP